MTIILGGLLLTAWVLNAAAVIAAGLKASDLFRYGFLSIYTYLGTIGVLSTLSVYLWSLVL